MKTTRNTSSGLFRRRWQTGKRKFIAPSGIVLFIIILISVFAGEKSYSQGVGISEASIVPNGSSVLELRSTLRGFLAPRMTTTEKNAIASPAQGLLVFDITTQSFWYYDSGWKAIASSALGTSNQLLGMNAAGNANEYKTLTGTSNRVSVVYTPGLITLSIPQDIHTSATPTFSGLFVSGLNPNSGVYTNGTSGLTSTPPTSGVLGYWTRTGSVLSPTTAGDAVTTSGNISTTSSGTITSAGLLTAQAGASVTGTATVSGGVISLNNSSNFATNINTGTSTGGVTIGNSANTITLPAFTTAGLVHNNATGVLSTGLLVNSDITNATIDLTSKVTGLLPIANGGTNSGTALSGSSIIISNGSSIVQGQKGTTTTVLHGDIAGAPTYGQVVNADIASGTIDLTSKVTNVLPVVNGGTGYDNTYTNGQLLIGNASGTLTRNPLTGTLNQVNVANGSGSITLSTPQDIHTGAQPTFQGLTLSGLNASAGVYTDASKKLTSTPPTSGTIGYWDRTGTVLSPTTAGDAVTTSGNISTTSSGTITSAGLLTAQAGASVTGAATVSGGVISLNNSSNFATNINTGTSTGGVTIGNSANTITLPAFTTAGLVHNNATGVLSTGLLVNSDITNATIDLTSKVTGVLPIANGGTNSGTALSGSSIVISDGTSIVQGDKGTTTTLLHGNIAGAPAYSQVVNADIANGTIDLLSKVTNVLPVVNGGTGLSTFGGINQILYTSAADVLTSAATSTGAGQFLQTTTAGGAPTWKSVLDVVNGGTGQSTYTDGQILIGNSTGNTLTKTTLTGTANQVNVANGSGSITLSTPQDIHTGAQPTFQGLTLSGLNASAGVYTDASKKLTSTPPTSGTIGYWDRTGTVLSPTTAGDAVTTSGNISTTSSGTITSAGLLTAQAGASVTGAATVSGGVISLNNSSNFATNINTGTSTGGVTIGNSANTITLPAFTTAGLVHNNATGVLSTGLLVNSDITNATIDLTSKVTGVLPIANGGTNSGTALSGSSIVISDGTSIVQGDKGTTTTLLHGNIAGAPAYSQVVNADIANGTIDLLSKVTNVLPVVNGGTGQSTYTDGQILIGNSTGNTLTKTTLTGTANQVNVANGSGSITLSTPQDIHTGAQPTFQGLTLSGLNASAGVYTDASKKLTSTPPTSGTIGYWDRTGTVLSPTTAGDAVTTSGNISTTSSGTITSAGLLTAQAGASVTGAATVSGGVISLNNSSNFATNINTGTSTGGVTIGNSANTITLPAFTTAGLVHNNATGVLSTGLLVNSDITNATIDLTSKVTGVLPIANGGTNSGTALSGSSIVISDGTSIVQGDKGTTTTLLHGNIAGAPAYSQVVNADIANGTIDLLSKVTNVLPVVNGGTGLSTFGGINQILYTSAADVLTSVATSTGAGQFLQTTTAGGAPTWKSVLDVVNGGTGQSTYTDGQILIGNSTGNTLTKTTLTGTANQVNVANGSGSITLSTPQDIHTGAQPTFQGLTLSGLNASAGVYTDASKKLTSTPPTSGTIGYWDRTGTVLSPTTAGDAVTTSGNISTTTSGTITSAGLLTGQAGATVTGAAVNLNNNSNFPTRINTGTSTGGVTIGGSANTISLPAFTTAGLVHNDASGLLSTGLIVNSDITNATIDLTAKVTGILPGSNGGTGVNNGTNLITVGGNFTTTPANDITLTTTGATNVTLPVTGTLSTLDGVEALTNKTVNGLTLAALLNGFSVTGGTTPATLTVPSNATVSGINTGDVTLAGQNYLSILNQVITANPVDLSGTNATGVLAAGRFPALTGDVTTTAGSVATTISPNAVTYAKMQNVSTTSKLLGSSSTTTPVQEISLGSGLSMSGTTLTATGLGGTVTEFFSNDLSPLFTTSVATSTTTPTLSFALTNANAYTIFGNNTNASAAPAYFAPVLASSLFAGQGTTSQVLHGGGAGNPSWGKIFNIDVDNAAGIDATKLSAGSVGNTEFDYLDGLTGSIQTQFNNEVTRATTAEGTLTTNLGNEVTRATTAEGVIAGNLTTEIARATGAEGTLTTNLANEVTNRTTAVSAVQSELDVTQSGAGLDAAGTYTANGAANYISGATSLKIADNLLDAQVKLNADNIAAITTNVTGLQTEVDAIETGSGLNVNGTYTANGTANYISTAISLKDADNKLDTRLKTTNDDLTTEVARATGAEGTLTTNLGNEVTRATTAEGVIAGNLTTEIARATGAEGTLTTNLANEVTNRTTAVSAVQSELDVTQSGAGLDAAGTYTANGAANYISGATSLKIADNLLDAQVKLNADNIAAITTNVTGLQTEVDAIETGSGLNVNGTYTANGTANYISTAISLKDVDNKLDTRLKTTNDDLTTEVARATGAEGTLTTNLGNEVTRATTAEGVIAGNLTTEIARATGAEGTLTTNLANEVTNRTTAVSAVQSELDVTQSGAGLDAAGTYTANGTANYISGATSLKIADNLLDAQVKLNADNIAAITTNVTGLQTEVDAIETGSGLNVNGTYTANGTANYISTAISLKDADNKLDTRLKTTNDDLTTEVARATGAEGTLTTNLGNEVTRATTAEGTLTTNLGNEVTRAATAEGVIAGNLTTEIARATGAEGTLTTNLANEVTNRTTAVSAVQSELDVTQSGAGLDAAGTYTANGTANYISGATSLKIADNLLDAQVKLNADNIAAITTNVTGLQTEVDAIETGSGLNVNGTYTANGTANYISTAISLKDADNKLDTRLKTTNDDLTTEVARATGAEGTLTTNLGNEVTRATTAEGTLTTNLGNEVTRATTAEGVIAGNLTTEIARATGAEGTLTTNLANEVTNRTTAVSAVQSELDVTQSGAGLDAAGTYTANGTANYISGATSLKIADNLLDAQVKLNADNIAAITTNVTGLQTEVDAIETGSGLNVNGTYTANGTANYISTAISLKDADNKLDTRLKTTNDDLTTEVARATGAEGTLTTNLGNEVTRATTAEGTLTTNLGNEVTRATTAEGVIAGNLTTEIARATGAEAALNTAIGLKENSANKSTDGTFSSNSNVLFPTEKATKTYVDNGLSGKISNYASQSANFFLAAPDGVAGIPLFRSIVAADIPTLNQNTTGTAANVTGTVAIGNGGTGQATQQTAINALAGGVTSGQYLRGNGTNVLLSSIQAGDVPTLNQNTTGTANIAGGTVGAIPYQTGANATSVLSATATANKVLMSGSSAAPVWSTPTFPNASATTRKMIVSDGTNWVASTETYAVPGAAGNLLVSDGTNWTSTLPTFNQNTTGSAAKWTTARNLAGNSVDGSANVAFANKFIVQGTADAGLSGSQFLGALSTGLVKNTTTTGVLSIATSGTDYSAGTSALATGILKSTTATGALSIAVAGDFPILNQNTTGTAANVTGTVAIGNGGTGQATQQTALNALAGGVTSGQYLRGNGTNVLLSGIQAGDVPTLNQNTTGTANIAGGTVGAIPYQTGANATSVLSATATANKVLMSGSSAAPVWSTPTFPNASATTRKMIVSDGTNWVASTETYAVPGAAGNLLVSDGTNWTSTLPTFNQNTTGSAAKWTTARNLAGNSVDGSANVAFANKFIVQGTADAGLSGSQFLGALSTGLVKNTTTTGVLSIATSGTDYSAGTSALATGILKSTTATGALSIAVAGDFPTLNQNTTGTAANVTGLVAIANGGTGSATQNFVDLSTVQTAAGAKTWSNLGTFNAGITVTGGVVNLNNDATANAVNIGTSTNTGTVTIGGTGSQIISVGNGAGVKTVNLGSANTTSVTNINSGTGAVNINADNNQTTNINTGTSTGAINIASGTTGGNVVTIGNLVSSTGIVERVGTGNYSLNGVSASTYTIGSSTIGGTINIGGTAQTGAITLGSSTASQVLNLGTGTGSSTVNIANGTAGNAISIANGANTVAQSINIGSGANAANNTINIGSGTNTAGTTSVNIGSGASRPNTLTLEAGTGNITIGASANARTWNVGTGNAIQTANLFTNATPANIINIGGAATTTNIGSIENTIGIAGTASGNGVRIGNGRLTVNKPVSPTTGINTNYTATVSEILDAGIIGFNCSAARFLIFPSAQGAAGIVQNLPGTPQVGDVFTFLLYNEGASDLALQGNASVTIQNPGIVFRNNDGTRVVYCRVTSVTSGSETISVY